MAECVNIKSFIDHTFCCPICQDNFVSPKALPCLHSLCLRCVKQLCNGKPTSDCPTCRKPFAVPPGGVEQLPDNFLIKECESILRTFEDSDQQLEEYRKTVKADDERVLQRQIAKHRTDVEKLSVEHRQEVEKIRLDCRAEIADLKRQHDEELGLQQAIQESNAEWIRRQYGQLLQTEREKDAGERDRMTKTYVSKVDELKNAHAEEMYDAKQKIESLQRRCVEYQRQIDIAFVKERDAKLQHERDIADLIRKYFGQLERARLDREADIERHAAEVAELNGRHDNEVYSATARVALNSTCGKGRLVDSWSHRESIGGLAVLDDKLYVCPTDGGYVEVYDVRPMTSSAELTSPRLLRRQTVTDLDSAVDTAACLRLHSVFIADPINQTVHRIDCSVSDKFDRDIVTSLSSWPTAGVPEGLSVNRRSNVVVAYRRSRTLREFDADGTPIREIVISATIGGSVVHVAQVTADHFVVCCSGGSEHPAVSGASVHVVDDQGEVLHSYNKGASKSSNPSWWSWFWARRQTEDSGRYVQLVADGVVFAADANNGRVMMMDPRLNDAREVISGLKAAATCFRLALDVDNNRMFVAYRGPSNDNGVNIYQL